MKIEFFTLVSFYPHLFSYFYFHSGLPATTNKGPINGAHVSYFDIDAELCKLVNAGLAYKSIRNCSGDIIRTFKDIEFGGLAHFCSANLFPAGSYGLKNDVFFTGEDISEGGTEFALDAKAKKLYTAPWMGQAAWESKSMHYFNFTNSARFTVSQIHFTGVTMFKQPNDNHMAILVGDDCAPAPLLLYIGEKQPSG